MMRKSGFTLVELLVVVAILALLIAILLPSLNKAKAAAKTVACLSNQHQCGVALQMYAGDYRGVIASMAGPPDYSGLTAWTKFIAHRPGQAGPEYLAVDSRSQHCVNNGRVSWYTPGWGPSDKVGSYAMVSPGSMSGYGQVMQEGVVLELWPNGLRKFAGLRMGGIEKSGDYAVLVDNAEQWVSKLQLYPLKEEYPMGTFLVNVYDGSSPTGAGQQAGVWMAHPDAANVLFVDGHSESCGENRLLDTDNYNRLGGAWAADNHGISQWWRYDRQPYHP